MSRFIIDDKAVEFIKETLKKEDAQAVRIFISGGGCCRRLEIIPVKKRFQVMLPIPGAGSQYI